MPRMLESFDDLIRAAREQDVRQRFILVFVRAVLPESPQAHEVAGFRAGQGGALVPVMYVDKGEHELSDFQSLAQEAEHVTQTLVTGGDSNWDLVIVGALGGTAVDEPPEADVRKAMHGVLEALRTGDSLSHLIAFDREGHPVRFG